LQREAALAEPGLAAFDPTALDRLERAYDGPIPEPARRAWRYGSAARADWIAASAQLDFFRTRLRRQIGIIRQRRATGTLTPDLLPDLALYRRQWRRWRREEARLRAAMTEG
jgi:hypothetical protein